MLTDRQLAILEAIIQDYTNIGQPVGSKKLQEQLPIHVSSATIRSIPKRILQKILNN